MSSAYLEGERLVNLNAFYISTVCGISDLRFVRTRHPVVKIILIQGTFVI
jgi:hypothetical protein